MDVHKFYTLGEEVANVITHGIGLLLSVAALTLMLVFAGISADPWIIVGVAIFGVAMLLTYLASTLYHALPHPNLKKTLRVIDHCAIFVLIAGTYTPFLLGPMRDAWGLPLLVLMWTAALGGCVFKIFTTGKMEWFSTALYVLMGWAAIFALKPALENIPPGALWLLLLGGLAYTGGVAFYLWNRLPYNHAIWHVFVMAGSTVHFFSVFYFVIPANVA